MKRFYVQLFLLMFFAVITAHSQESKTPVLKLGDPAPQLSVNKWLKGKPVEKFEKGKVYIVEFWATWCAPCKASMPRLSKLARKYKKKVTVMSIDVYEKKTTPVENIKFFVDSMGRKMDYRVATEDSNFMETAWLNASGESGIPQSFVVNAEGRLAWIGHPLRLHEVLPDILNDHWDINDALAKRNSDRYLEQLDDSLNFDLNTFHGKSVNTYGQPDSGLAMISEIIKKEPKLTYAPFMASNTFAFLMKTNTHKAYEYGKQVLVTRAFDEPGYDGIIPNYDVIINVIQADINQITIPAEIYELGAEAYQVEVDELKKYPELYNLFSYFNKMAEWYWRAGDKAKAIRAQKKAIKALKKAEPYILNKNIGKTYINVAVLICSLGCLFLMDIFFYFSE